jgi:uncharacterized Tic20 family protein
MRLSLLHLTFLLELCLLGLASFLRPILLWTFWRFYSKAGECETKASLWLKPTGGFKPTSGFKDMRPTGRMCT